MNDAMPRRLDVLIVDDVRDLREAMREVLEDEGFRVACAADGRDAIRCFADARPALVLLDLEMPGMDGWSFTRWLRSQPSEIAATPVMLVSAHEELREAAQSLGIRDWAHKPLRPEVLVDAVKRLVRG